MFPGAMLYVSETWHLTKPDLQHLRYNDKAMIRQMCNIKPEDVVTVRSKSCWQIDYIAVIPREKRIRWFVHVERFSGAIKTLCDMQIVGERGPWRPKTTWMTQTERDLREWKLNKFDPCDYKGCVNIQWEICHACS